MTKTFNSVVSNRFKLLGLTVTTPLVGSVRLSLVWNFVIGSLGFVCILIFGAWNFQYFHKTGKYLEVCNQLANMAELGAGGIIA